MFEDPTKQTKTQKAIEAIAGAVLILGSVFFLGFEPDTDVSSNGEHHERSYQAN